MCNTIRRSWPRILQRLMCYILCVVVIFGAFAGAQRPAQAIAWVIPAAAGAVICGTALVAAGLIFAEEGSFDAAVAAFMDALPPDALSALDMAVNNSKLMLSAVTGNYFLSTTVPDLLWGAARSWVVDNFNIGANSVAVSGGSYAGDVDFVNGRALITGKYDFFRMYYVFNQDVTIPDAWNTKIPAGAVCYVDYYSVSPLNPNYQLVECYMSDFERSTAYNNFQVHYGPHLSVFVDSVTLLPMYTDGYQSWGLYTGWKGVPLATTLFTEYVPGVSVDAWGDTQVGVGVDDWSWENTHTGERSVSVPIATASEKAFPAVDASGALVIDQARVYDQVIDADYADVAGVDVGGIPVASTETGEIVQPVEVPADITIPTQITEPGNLKALFFSKFPFCLPWDLKNAIMLIAAPPKAPSFDVDLLGPVRQKMGLSADAGKFIIEFSKFELIAAFFRWVSTIGFCVILIRITRELIKS